MACSMTGFARTKIGNYLIEVQTINKKGSELSLSLPRDLLLKESFIRKKLGSLLTRGHVFVKIFSEEGAAQKISKEACARMHSYLTNIAKSLDPNYEVSFDTVLKAVLEFDVSKKEEKEDWESEWDQGLSDLWHKLLAMKKEEGSALVRDILLRVGLIRKAVDRIEKENGGAAELFGKKILERLEQFKATSEEDRDRVMREVMIYAEKVDITEEVVRMRSHLTQVEKLVTEVDEPVGRTIDFLVQEMMREANTMGSKAPGVQSMNEVIFIKGEIEKIRQQGSNIE